MTWEHSSAGRASALQAEGHRFEPYCSHHNGPVVQLVRTLACHARGRGFESHPGRHLIQPLLYASVAQLVEQGTENPRVVGSIPTGGTTICGFSSFGRARPCQGRGGGFDPRNPLQKDTGTPQYVPVDFCNTDGLPSVDILMSHPFGVRAIRALNFIWRHSQVVRQRSAKPLSPGSNPGGASKKS